MGYKNIDMKVMKTKTQIINEMKKGTQFIIFADLEVYEERNTIRIITEDIIYYDKDSKRYRFMLGSLVTDDFVYVYPVRSLVTKKGLKDFDDMCKLTGLDLSNYDKIFSVNKKYVKVENDMHKQFPFKIS